MSTGNGCVTVTGEIELQLDKIGVIKAIPIDECRINLLSLGTLVLEQGYKFY